MRHLDTAPRDGTAIILFPTYDIGSYRVRFDGAINLWRCVDGSKSFGDRAKSFTWMPLSTT